ncbi:MAG: zinc ABC transporter solute-binding protein [Xanthomonadaceae bacterium]|nr:zinc ABC transporter solute-binding protein [Xanthomonadaceae bacterium]
MSKFIGALLLMVLIFCTLAFPALARVRAIVSIMPQKFFLEQLAGDLVEVEVMVPPGASPHTYEPRPSQMMALNVADIYFSIGVEFEKNWIPRFRQLNERLVFVDTSRGIEKVPMVTEGKTAAKRGKPSLDCGLDPHIWLAPRLVRKISRTMADSLSTIDPEHRQIYQQHLATWEKKLQQLDEQLYQSTRPMQVHPCFLVFHPSWGYFAREYGLRQLAVEHHGSEPGPRYLASLIDRARKLGIKTIFVQPQYQGNSARVLARALGGSIVKIDPLVENWLENLKTLARKLAEVYH